MREIKFRIWNGNNMVDLYSTTKFAIKEDLKIDGLFIPFYKDYILMQFTGVYDKNNKEIYEGDICKGEYCASNAGIYINSIKWDIQSAWFEFANSPLWTWEYLEVIGNIHENPELLK